MLTHILGFPRIGSQRELKRAQELFWGGSINEDELKSKAQVIKEDNWQTIADSGIDLVPVGDFSLYDHILDTSVMLGVVPDRFKCNDKTALGTYFSMARGEASLGLAAMEMTKWFDTNYHYIVPEFSAEIQIKKECTQLIADARRAKALGHDPKVVLIGPITYLAIGKEVDGFDRWQLLPEIVQVYEEILAELEPECSWIQFDEPILSTDLSDEVKGYFSEVYQKLGSKSKQLKVLVASYFEALEDNLPLFLNLECDALHFDLVRGEGQLDEVLKKFPQDKTISLGLIDGRNIWKSDLKQLLDVVTKVKTSIDSDRIMIGSSCSLLHSPVDLELETKLDEEVKSWLAFAVQKCGEIDLLKRLSTGEDLSETLAENIKAIKSKQQSKLTHVEQVRSRCSAVTEESLNRQNEFLVRKANQAEVLNLPELPTTTIGSFPQTPQIRKLRHDLRQNNITKSFYLKGLKEVIAQNILIQEELGLDVLVHGEPERNDMVEYFGEMLDGIGFTSNGWVQSYGSRCVKPPVIYGDVSRPKPMTVDWISYANSLSKKQVKGMLTGPVTILCWSFVRNDLSRQDVCQQIALAIADEVNDLEAAGIQIIQVDEAAFREGMPLKSAKQDSYLNWAVDSFRLTVGGVKDETQIHTHMCYSDFNTIAPWILKMDADVISIEASRSGMRLLDSFKQFSYPNDIGPGIYDIHSPRVPSVEEQVNLLKKALEVIPAHNLWVNPDCGLKTRGWVESKAALKNMVEATKIIKSELKANA